MHFLKRERERSQWDEIEKRKEEKKRRKEEEKWLSYFGRR